MIDRSIVKRLIEDAALAPSVHNVQPARWRIEADGATLFEDLGRRLHAGDPTGRDAAVSLGAAAEGFRLAASTLGLLVDIEGLDGEHGEPLRPVVRLRLSPGATPDPLAEFASQRASWRARFEPVTDADRRVAQTLTSEDVAIISQPTQLVEAGQKLDEASWSFLSDDAFRGELLSWMRLSRSSPNWARDGLNAEAMAMNAVEAFGAGLVLGPLFKPLDTLGAARLITSEGKQAANAVALVVFHRPVDEPPFDSGGHFYRAWLRAEAAGFAASVLASLVDNPTSAQWCSRLVGLPPTRRLAGVLRIGRRETSGGYARARLPIDELIVP